MMNHGQRYLKNVVVIYLKMLNVWLPFLIIIYEAVEQVFHHWDWISALKKCPNKELLWSWFSNIQFKCRNIRTIKTLNTDTLTHCRSPKNVRKTFLRRPWYHMSIFCTFNSGLCFMFSQDIQTFYKYFIKKKLETGRRSHFLYFLHVLSCLSFRKHVIKLRRGDRSFLPNSVKKKSVAPPTLMVCSFCF